MYRSQGKYFSNDEVDQTVRLLRDGLTVPEIAERMHCSRQAVAAINRKFQIRPYHKKRNQGIPLETTVTAR